MSGVAATVAPSDLAGHSMPVPIEMPAALPQEVLALSARLPQTYEAAKVALTECAQVDECQDWADKAAALASYAKQAEDDTLYKTAIRIQARALKRAGELLLQFDARGGDRSKSEGAPTSAQSRQQVASDAGMSRHQQVTAVRVARVPAREFEAVVESEAPPTVTKLAAAGTARRQPSAAAPAREPEPRIVSPPAPSAHPAFQQATYILGRLRAGDLTGFCRSHQPAFVAAAVQPYDDIPAMRKAATEISAWLATFAANLKEA